MSAIANTMRAIPSAFQADLLDEYKRRASHSTQEAEHYLANIRHSLDKNPFLNHSDKGLRSKAKRYALYSTRLIANNNYATACQFAESMAIELPNKCWKLLLEQWQVAHKAAELWRQSTHSNNEVCPYSSEIEKLRQRWLSIKARLMDEKWWIRRLIRKQDREFEKFAIHWGRVRKGKQLYVSNETLEKITARRNRSLEIMQGLLAVSDEGDEVDMVDILKGSIANPAVRMAELMNRIYGFEEYAKQHGHMGEFYTFTAPSKYHANSNKYAGYTPSEVQKEYFSPMWARIRAKLHKEGLTIYGFRIAESHKDGCTHWHILLFMPQQQVVKVSNILVDYAFREAGTETGAYLSRFDWEEINPKQGSAVGYIIKYISKNIAAFNFDKPVINSNDSGQNSSQNKMQTNENSSELLQKGQENQASQSELAQRVAAWASVWGVRQFQQIGGSSVSVWRELRRLGDQEQADPIIEAARQAANSGDWKSYLEVQDGINLPRKDQPIQLYRAPHCDAQTGEILPNKYGEIVDVIQGLQTEYGQLQTRLKQWTIQEKDTDKNLEKQQIASDSALSETPEIAIQRLLKPTTAAYTDYCDSGKLDANATLAFDLPWSSVNNCRHPDIADPNMDEKFIESLQKLYQNNEYLYKKSSISQDYFIKTILKMS